MVGCRVKINTAPVILGRANCDVQHILSFRGKKYESNCRLTGQYAHYVDGYIVYQAHGDSTMRRAKQTPLGVFDKCNDVVLKDSCAYNNFRVVENNSGIYREYKYIAVGGTHYNSSHNSISSISTQYQNIKLYDPVWPQIERSVMVDNFYHPKHANGIYIFVSNDMKKWTPVSPTPVLSMLTECVNYPTGTLGPDWMPSLVYDCKKQKFLLYVRANIKLGVRHVFVCESKNLIEWSAPRLITLNNTTFDLEHDNFYYLEVIPFKSSKYNFLAFAPYFRNDVLDDRGTRKYYNEKNIVLQSVDGLYWDVKTELKFENRNSEDPSGHMTFPHILSATVCEGNIKLYVHEKFLTTNNYMKTYEFPITFMGLN